MRGLHSSTRCAGPAGAILHRPLWGDRQAAGAQHQCLKECQHLALAFTAWCQNTPSKYHSTTPWRSPTSPVHSQSILQCGKFKIARRRSECPLSLTLFFLYVPPSSSKHYIREKFDRTPTCPTQILLTL